MPTLKDQITEARNHKYTDDEISDFLAQNNPDIAPKIKEAKGHGYASKDINDFLMQDEDTTPVDQPNKFLSGFTSVVNPSSVGQTILGGVAPTIALARAHGNAIGSGYMNQDEFNQQATDLKAAHDKIAGHIQKGEYGQALGAVGSDILDRFGMSGLRERLEAGDHEGAAGMGVGLLSLLGLGGGTAAATTKASQALQGATAANPDLALINAAKPHTADTGFMENAPFLREAVKRGESLSDTPITDVPSAVKATDAAMKEYMDALETHKAAARDKGLTMPTSVLKARAIKALPDGLEHLDPAQYNAAVNEINHMFEGKDHLSVDEVFDQARLNNGMTARFHASPESAQNNKLVTNGGDTATLKAMGDTYRQWINENLGPMASDLNAKWGQMNQLKHYFEAKVNPAIQQEAMTPLGRLADKFGISPDHAMFGSKESIIQGVLKRLTGEPRTYNEMIRAAFDPTEPGAAPVEINQRQPIMRDDRLLPPSNSKIGVSGVTVPDIMGEAIKAGKQVSGGPRQIEAPGVVRRIYPPAATHNEPVAPVQTPVQPKGNSVIVSPQDVKEISLSKLPSSPEVDRLDQASMQIFKKKYRDLSIKQAGIITRYAYGNRPIVNLQDLLDGIH